MIHRHVKLTCLASTYLSNLIHDYLPAHALWVITTALSAKATWATMIISAVKLHMVPFPTNNTVWLLRVSGLQLQGRTWTSAGYPYLAQLSLPCPCWIYNHFGLPSRPTVWLHLREIHLCLFLNATDSHRLQRTPMKQSCLLDEKFISKHVRYLKYLTQILWLYLGPYQCNCWGVGCTFLNHQSRHANSR